MSPRSTMPAPPPLPTGVLTVELVPASCWASNVRSLVKPSDWEKCKRFVRNRSGARCEICGGVGKKWPVECHEVWVYDLPSETQVLTGLVALCPSCHGVKHFGFSESLGRGAQMLTHLSQVNGWTLERATIYLQEAFELWRQRSRVEWSLNLGYLTTLGIEPLEVPAGQRQIGDYS